ncbi:uncharacterized protein [Nicotiana sylvestris]|uniref:uncharacterized protein n=1 Tax=Nicotiana sylvestris TaxID=4096 RepID=UPI00388CD6D1
MSFVKRGAEKPPTSSIPKPVVDVDEELIKRFQSLFKEVNMVEVGEGFSKADVHLVGPKVKLSNWEATSLPTRKEFCSFYAGCSDMTCMKSFQPSLKNQSNSEITIQEVEYDDKIEYDEEAAFEEISKELKQFEEKTKPNLSETEAINLGDQDDVRETKISVHLESRVKEEIIKTLFEYKDVFACSYDDMPGLSTDLVVHKLPTDPASPHVKQKLRKFKTDMSVKIKEEITKQLTAKSKKQSDHVKDLRKFFQRLRRYNLKLNPAKCVFGVPSGKLLGFVVSRRDIELDPSKIKAIQELPPPKNKTELLKKNDAVKWTDECQEAFDKIKWYLSNPPVLVPPEPGRPLILYLTVLDNSFGCVLGQHDITGKKEQEIYYISKKFTPYEVKSVEFRHIPRIYNEIADALATLTSMLHHPNKAYVDLVHIQVHDQHAYCNVVEEEIDGEPWFHYVKEYIRSGVYPVHATGDQKRTIRCLGSGFFLSGGILYKRTPDLGLLRCIDAKEASIIMAEVHSGVHGDLIHSPPSELQTMSAPWPFVAWVMDIIGPVEPAASNGHGFILVAIDYFTKGKKIFKSTGASHGKAWFREQEILFRILKDESMTQDPPG